MRHAILTRVPDSGRCGRGHGRQGWGCCGARLAAVVVFAGVVEAVDVHVAVVLVLALVLVLVAAASSRRFPPAARTPTHNHTHTHTHTHTHNPALLLCAVKDAVTGLLRQRAPAAAWWSGRRLIATAVATLRKVQ
jgi:hypothetical protein